MPVAEVKIDCYLTETHYWAHLGPVWDALPSRLRGKVFAPRDVAVDAVRRRPSGDRDAVLVASGGDARQIAPQCKLVHLQHGVGQSYNGNGTSEASWGYAGGDDLDHVDLFLCVNTNEAAQWKARYPHVEVRTVGAPCMDGWPEDRMPVGVDGPPVVAFSFHWQCRAAPEAGTAWSDWRRALTELCALPRLPYRILGHEHPRWHGRLLAWWEQVGADIVCPTWADVMEHASLYICDNSSTMYEFAATGRPVFGLRSHRWREDIDHGLRFGALAPPVDLDPPITADGLDRLIRFTLDRPNTMCPASWREETTRHLYGTLDGMAAARAAHAIKELLG